MSVGPLRRVVGAVGLVALIPVAVMLVSGALDPVDAAARATVVLIALLVLGRVASGALTQLASTFERAPTADQVGSREEGPTDRSSADASPRGEPARTG